jgi:hypothetical protein
LVEIAMNESRSSVFDETFLRGGEELQELLLFLLKGGINKQARDAIGLAAASYVSRKTASQGLGGGSRDLSDQCKAIIGALQKTGYALIDSVFTPAEVLEIETYFKDKKVRFGASGHTEKGRKGETLFDDLPPDIRFAYYGDEDIRKCPAIYRAVHSQHLLDSVSGYLGAPPTISSVTLWWTFPSTTPPGGMQMFHHDRGDFRSCNLFVYLTDVSEVTGPHSFVTGTHDINILHPLTMERFGGDMNTLQRFWSWMEVHRKSDEDVHQYFREDEVVVYTGAKGTSFLEDTRGLHKATIPIMGPRLAFEIVYSTLPKFNERVTPISRKDLAFDSGGATLDPLARYAARLTYC